MKILPAKEIDVNIPLDIETFMNLAQVKELEGRETMEMVELWTKWRPHLKTYSLGRKRGYLVVFMDNKIEDEIDGFWDESPSRGFKVQALVQTMIMGVLKELMPEIGRDQCAPLPKPGSVLKKSLSRLGVELHDQGTINYKYSSLTYYPFRGGCDYCYLASSCPKINLPKLEGLFRAGPDA